MDHTTARKTMTGCCIACIVCCLIGRLTVSVNDVVPLIFVGLGFALVIATHVIQLLYWRCPSCGKHLPTRHVGKLEYCPYCGSFL